MEAGFIPAASFGGNPAPTRDGGGGSGIMAPQVPVIREPDLKRRQAEEAISDRIKLESVLGLTVGSNAALDSDPNTELVAYPAGCTVVLYNVRKNRQLHVLNACRKSVTCVAFSPDGRYLATGECGHAPAVRVWDLQDVTTSVAVQIAELPHGANCVVGVVATGISPTPVSVVGVRILSLGRGRSKMAVRRPKNKTER